MWMTYVAQVLPDFLKHSCNNTRETFNTTQFRYMVDFAAGREAYNQPNMSTLALQDPEYIIADPFTKIVHCPLLEEVINRLSLPFDQAIYFGCILELRVILNCFQTTDRGNDAMI